MGRKRVKKATRRLTLSSNTIDGFNSDLEVEQKQPPRSDPADETKNTVSSRSDESLHPVQPLDKIEEDTQDEEDGDQKLLNKHTADEIVLSFMELEILHLVVDILKKDNADQLMEIDYVALTDVINLPVLRDLVVLAESGTRNLFSLTSQLKETESKLNSERIKFEEIITKVSKEISEANDQIHKLQSKNDEMEALLEKERLAREDLEMDLTTKLIDAENGFSQAKTELEQHLTCCNSDVEILKQQLLEAQQDAEYLVIEQDFVKKAKEQAEEEVKNLRLTMECREAEIVQERREMEMEARNRVKTVEDELAKASKKITILEADVKAARSEVATAELELDRRDSELKKVFEDMTAMEQEIVTLRTEKELAETVEQWEKCESSVMGEEVELLRKKIDAMESTRSALEKEVKQKDKLIKDLNLSLEKFSEELYRTEQEQCLLHEKFMESEDRYDTVLSELQITKEQMVSDADSYHRRESELASELESLKACTSEVSDLKAQNAELLKCLESEVELRKREKEEHVSALKTKDMEFAQMTSSSHSKLDDEKHLLQCEIEMIKSRNGVLEEEIARRDKKEQDEKAQSSEENFAMANTIKQLQSKNSRLEQDLRTTQKEIESIETQYVSKLKSLEEESRRSRAEIKRLLQDLEEARFKAEQAMRANDGREHTKRVLELERKISMIQTENAEKIVQIGEELREAREREMQCELQLSSSSVEISNLRSSVELWQERFESATRELETLRKATPDVNVLENILHQANNEKANLRECLDSVRREADSLREQLSAAQTVSAVNGMGSISKSPSLDRDFRDVPLVGEVHIDVEGSNVSSSPQQPLLSDYDFLSGSAFGQTIIRATAPYTPVLAGFYRRIRHLQHRRALYPYFRYIFAAYMFVVHLIILHCWFM